MKNNQQQAKKENELIIDPKYLKTFQEYVKYINENNGNDQDLDWMTEAGNFTNVNDFTASNLVDHLKKMVWEKLEDLLTPGELAEYLGSEVLSKHSFVDDSVFPVVIVEV